MQISKDKVASFHYRLFEGSEMLEDSEKSDPMLYMHGRKGLFQGLGS